MSVSSPPPVSKSLPRAVCRTLRQARLRYWQAPLETRPNLADPTSYLGLFHCGELTGLARAGYWPLPAEALAQIAVPPTDPKRRRRVFRVSVEAALAKILTTKAAAVRALLFARRNGVANGKA